MALDKQIHLYSIDTSFFYTNKERDIHSSIQKLQIENKKKLRPVYNKKIKEINKLNDELKENEFYIEYEKISSQLKELYSQRKLLKDMGAGDNRHELFPEYITIINKVKELKGYKEKLQPKVDEINFFKIDDIPEYKKYKDNNVDIKRLKEELKVEFRNNENIQRKITSDFKTKDIISMFESSLSRTMGLQHDDFTEDLMVVRVYYFEVFKNIVLNGYYHKGEKYMLWSASAGQIRTKKCVFIKESVFNKYYNTIYCGLTLDKINSQRIKVKDGVETIEQGCNVNKYMAYTSLIATASEEWSKFDIDKAIVVDDFETTFNTVVDYIDYNEYDEDNLWKITRKNMDVTIPTMDGAGICLDYTGMFRLPWIKGLMVKFPYIQFIKEQRKLEKEVNPSVETKIGKVKDIYGKEYDILRDNIRFIFTKSQFKMWKYYDSWDQYKEYFKKYNCEACICNSEEDEEFNDANISYQPLQSLYDLSDEELLILLKDTNNTIESIGNDRNKILKTLGAVKNNSRKSYYQEALILYPELLNDRYSKKLLKEAKASIVNKARYGKIKVDGIYTFIIPDLYAFAEWLFCHNDSPKGLLKKGEVSCNLFENDIELDMIRSPHLNFSHCINVNKLDDSTNKWFKSNGIYTSIFSTDSLELMFDVDGDKSLVIKDKTIIEASKRIRKKHDIVPLYYELKKAKDNIIDNQSLYDGMISAYKGGKIGEVSNSITKIWNHGDISKVELKAISYLTLWNNCTIDYAKTLWLPSKSDEMERFLKQYTGKKLPHFFIYIRKKEKEEHQVERVNNSVTNRMQNLVVNPRITFKAKNCGEFDYINLLNNKDISTETELAKTIVKKFRYINANKKFLKRDDVEDKHDFTNTHIRRKILNICSDINYVVDVLVKHYYCDTKSENKRTLWDVFGDVIIENIKNNIDLNTIMCERCGVRVEITNNKIKYCDNCAKEIFNQQCKVNMREMRKRLKVL